MQSAFASNGITITYASLSTAEKTAMKQRILMWADPGLTDDAYSGMYEAAQAGGVEAGLGAGTVLGSAALLVGGSYVVYRIADGLGLGNYVYRKLTGENMPSNQTYTITQVQWKWIGGTYARGGVTPAWEAEINCNPSNCGGTGPGTAVYCIGGSTYDSPDPKPALQPMGPNVAASVGGYGSGYCASGTQTITWATDAQIAGLDYGIRVTPATQTDWNNAPSGQAVTAPGARVNTCNDTCLQNALAGVNAATPSSQTTKQAKAVQVLADAGRGADAGSPGIVGQSFLLLQPLPNETYIEYYRRLVNEGYLGTYTNSVESVALPGYGPTAITRVTFNDGYGNTQTLDPLNWPTTNPSLSPNVAIAVRENPSTAAPAPTSPGTTPTGVLQVQDTSTGPGNNVGSIDWTPIESINFGSKFPFGIPGYVNSFFSTVPTGSSCPTLSIGKPSALGGGTIDIPFCSTEWETTYRSPIFLVLEALMTLAGVTWLAQKITGSGSDE